MRMIWQRQRHVKQQAAQEAIYEAALTVMSRPDFAGLRMQDIAREVGIATGTLYNYFKNKEDLLYCVNQRLHEAIMEQVEKISRDPGPARERLHEVMDAVFGAVGRYHVVFDLAERSGVHDRMPVEHRRGLIEHGVACFERLIADGIEAGQFRAVDVRRTATVLFDAVIGVCEVHKYVGDHDYGPSRRHLLEMFEDYLKPV